MLHIKSGFYKYIAQFTMYYYEGSLCDAPEIKMKQTTNKTS